MLRLVEARLANAGLAEPRAEARALLKAAGVPAEDLIARPERRLDEAAARRVFEIAERRAAREPLSRIVGEREFYGRAFQISPATLDPRPDTETLIEAALEVSKKEGWDRKPIRILDVGTGSGCLLVTLLAELPLASGLGTDICAEALKIAKVNAARHGVASRARFAAGRSLSGVDETFDLLVSNPPYISTADIENLAPEVRDHDPRMALDGGRSGLDVYREIGDRLVRVIPNGWALFEVGAGQARGALVELDGRGGARAERTWREWADLGGHIRCIGARIRS